jgi:hypothetical protein
MRPSTAHVARAGRAALLAALVLSLAAGTALAGKPSGGKGSTTATVRVDNGVFAGTTTAYAGPSTATWVRARCYQGGVLVFEQYRQFDSSRRATLQLGPTPSWSGGAASCNAQDGYWRNGSTWRATSTSSFSVSG